eukprot:215267-Chlamydomonas_euryale.AAC.4
MATWPRGVNHAELRSYTNRGTRQMCVQPGLRNAARESSCAFPAAARRSLICSVWVCVESQVRRMTRPCARCGGSS